MVKKYIQRKLEKSVQAYFTKHSEVKLVAVVGSVGKTSTKMAIGTVLGEKYRIRLHEGNHNSELSAPLAILGVEYPENIRSLGQWMTVFRAVRARIKQPSDVDVIIQELGTDGIGQIPHFGTYLTPDITVVTAVADEHMEFFKTLDAVAAEELSAANYSKLALINRDDIDGKYATDMTNPHINTYGSTEAAEYRFIEEDYSLETGFTGLFVAADWAKPVAIQLHVAGEHSTRAAIAAGAVAVKLGLNPDEIASGLAKVRPVKGRMNILRGVQDSIIIDDSYNSSPIAAISALRALYQISAPQRIAVLGSMNELGDVSAAAHKTVGEMCHPSALDSVVTVGAEAAKYLAPAAMAQGCKVTSFPSAIEAGAYVHKVLEDGAAVLFKGSQGGVYLEEAVKVILHSSDDQAQLVRQSPAWVAKKQQFFSSLGPVIKSDD